MIIRNSIGFSVGQESLINSRDMCVFPAGHLLVALCVQTND